MRVSGPQYDGEDSCSFPYLQPLASAQNSSEMQNLGLPHMGVTHKLYCGRIPRTNAIPTVSLLVRVLRNTAVRKAIPMWPTQYTVGFFPLLIGHWFQYPSIWFQHLQRLWAVSLTVRVTRNPARISLCVFVVGRAGRERYRLNPCAKGLPPKDFLVLLVLTDLGIPTSHIHTLHGTPVFQYRAMNHTADSVSHFLPGTSSKALEPGL